MRKNGADRRLVRRMCAPVPLVEGLDFDEPLR